MKKAIFIFLFCAFIISCKKQDPIYPFIQENIVKEGLTFEEDSLIASLPAVIPKASEIILSNGETIEDFLKRTDPNALPHWGETPVGSDSIQGADDVLFKFITDLTSEGNSMINNQTPYPIENSVRELVEKPKGTFSTVKFEQPDQVGYGYVYNGDIDLTKRKRAGDCPLKLFGIDCSGMVTRMLIRAGANFNSVKYNAAHLAQEDILNEALFDSKTIPDFNYEYQNEPPTFIDQANTGDIIYFQHPGQAGAFHLGVLVRIIPSNELYIYQSNGSDVVSKPGENDGCERYSNAQKRGPRCVPVQKIINWENVGFYGILHLAHKTPPDVLLIAHPWKFNREYTSVANGHQQLRLRGVGTVNAENLVIKCEPNFSYSMTEKDTLDNCAGKYLIFKRGKSIKLFGCDIYGRDPITAQIQELNDDRFTLMFTIQLPGYKQYSTLYFVK